MSDLNQITNLIKAGNKTQARALLLDLLHADPANELGWLYLAACAANKQEFATSLEQVFKLNPLNSQARQLAEKYGLPVPALGMIDPKKAKKRLPKTTSAASGRNRLRLILFFITLIAVIGLGGFLFLNQGDTKVETLTTSETSTQEPTAEPTTEPTEIATQEPTELATEIPTSEPTEIATQEPTELATEIPTSEPTEIATQEPTELVTEVPTSEPTEIATQEPTTEATVVSSENLTIEATESPEPTPEITAEPTQEVAQLPILAPQDYFIRVEVVTGRDETNLQNLSPYPADVPLYAQVQLADHGESLTLVTRTRLSEWAVELSLVEEVTVDPSPAHIVNIPIKRAETSWAEGEWVLILEINGEEVGQTQLFINEAVALAPTAETVEALPTEEALVNTTATPTTEPAFDFPDLPPMLQLVYNPDTLYLKNITDQKLDISAVRFVQTTPNQAFIFETIEWQFDTYRGDGSVYMLQPDSCFQVGVESELASIKPRECVRLNSWKVRDIDGQFWLINNGNVRSFVVYYHDQPLAQCDIDAGLCEFGLPEEN